MDVIDYLDIPMVGGYRIYPGVLDDYIYQRKRRIVYEKVIATELFAIGGQRYYFVEEIAMKDQTR